MKSLDYFLSSGGRSNDGLPGDNGFPGSPGYPGQKGGPGEGGLPGVTGENESLTNLFRR